MQKHKTIHDNDFKIVDEDLTFNYQEDLTDKLDDYKVDFNQDVINEIVLWKVNRFALLDENTLGCLNRISKNDEEIDVKLTTEVLSKLLLTKGVQLAMASTILRFKNPAIFQIIDQRVYRLLYDHELKLKTYLNEKNIASQIELYLNYLSDLRDACQTLSIKFEYADRILFMADRRVNSKHKLKNY